MGIRQSLLLEEYNVISGKQSHDGAEVCCRTIRKDPFESDGCILLPFVRFLCYSAHDHHFLHVQTTNFAHSAHSFFSCALPTMYTPLLNFAQKCSFIGVATCLL